MEFPNIGRHRWIKETLKTCITEPISSDVTDATNCHCPTWYWQLFSSIQSSSSQISCPSFPLPEDPHEIPVHKVSAEKSEQHTLSTNFNLPSLEEFRVLPRLSHRNCFWAGRPSLRTARPNCWWKSEQGSIVFASVITEGYWWALRLPFLRLSATMSDHAESPIYTLRASMDASQYVKVDAGLKNFKLLSRQLHTLLNTHATELQILQRLYYKNKNQHRGSLFWRKVVEIKRYSERFEQHRPHILIDDFRCAFYGPDIPKYGSNHFFSSAVFTLGMQYKFFERSVDPLSGCKPHFLYLEQD